MELSKKKWYILGGTIAAAVVLILLIVIIFINREYRQDAVNAWQQVIAQSKIVAEKSKNVTNEKTAREFTGDLEQLSTIVEMQKTTVEKLNETSSAFVTKNKRLQDLLTSYSNYLQALITITKDPVNFTDKEVENLSKTLADLKEKMIATTNKTFISDQLPNEILALPQKLIQIRDDWQKQVALEQQKKAAEAAATAQAESTVTKFMDAYILRNKDLIKRYMTDSYEKEFNFSQFDWPEDYIKSKTYRILEMTRANEKEFQVTVILNIIYKSYSDSSEYTSSVPYLLRVVYDEKYKAWLVDRMDHKS